MNTIEFFRDVDENLASYLMFLFFSATLHIALYRRLAISFLDPMAVGLFGNTFAMATAFFLFYVDESSVHYLPSYLVTEVAFWGAMIAIAPSRKVLLLNVRSMSPSPIPNGGLFLFSFLAPAFVILRILQYTLVGIPLFANNRLGMATDTGGLGIFQTGANLLFPVLLYYVVTFISRNMDGKFLSYCMLPLILVDLVLSGSKTTIFPLIQMGFMFMLFSGGDTVLAVQNYLRKNVVLLFLILASLAIFSIFSKEQDIDESIALMGIRLVGFGDIYYSAYANDVINIIETTDIVSSLFYPGFALLRFIDYSNVPSSLGSLVNQQVYDLMQEGGPNARHNVLGYYLMGGLAFVFSAIIGFIVGFLRRMVLRYSFGFYERYFSVMFLYWGSLFLFDASYGLTVLMPGVAFSLLWVLVGKGISSRAYLQGISGGRNLVAVTPIPERTTQSLFQ